MSKAFTRESDDLPDSPLLSQHPSPLPPGAKNYMTASGAQRLREELDRLLHAERPRLATLPLDDEARRQRGLVDQRILQLQQSLQSAEVVLSAIGPGNHVRFGATVTVKDSVGNESQYRIVGLDETDVDRGWVSWLSPIAKSLLNRRLGERVRFKFPSGEEELEIVAVSYE